MNGIRVRSLVIASILLLTCAPRFAGADDSCVTKRCQNAAAIQDMRTSIAAECDCAGAASAPKYMACVKRMLKTAIAAGQFANSCKGAVAKCEAAVGCGKGIRPFRTVQQIFTQSCALPTCHDPISRQGSLVLATEDVSYTSLINRPVAQSEGAASGALLVKPGDPKGSFLVQKLLGTAPGDRMPQVGTPLSKGTIKLIEAWIKRGAKTTEQECPPAGTTGAKKRKGKSCNDRPLRAGNYVWQPQPALEVPAPGTGIQLYTPPRNVDPGTEWETCYAFKNIDWLGLAAQMGYPPGEVPMIKQQTYRMHSGSHHLLLYGYFGAHPEAWADGYFPCSAASCRDENPNDCPDDASLRIPIGGTQVAGTRYEVIYPEGVGIPVLSPNMVLIANLHYTNPFQPPQEIYGESWLNLYFSKPDERKAILDGIFAINYAGLLVEPYDTKTISSIWKPRGLLTRENVDAAVFQLFGHMHKRGTEFKIDVLRDGACSTSGSICGRDDDCQTGQTCVRGPAAEDSTIYYTTAWDRAPVMDFQKPYLRINHDQGLRWTCTHVNGVLGDDTRPPKRCKTGCRACGWDATSGQCIFDRDICLGRVPNLPQTCTTDADCPAGRACRPVDCGQRGSTGPTNQCARVFNDGDPMPLVFGELADDDMCNMFGYFIKQSDADALQ